MLILTVIPKMYHIHFLKNIEIKDKLSFIPHNNVLRYIVSKVNSSVIVNGALGLRALKPKPPPIVPTKMVHRLREARNLASAASTICSGP